MICYIGMGSNVGDRAVNINRAVRYLKDVEGFKVKRISALYETQAQGGPKGQRDYFNLVVEGDCSLKPPDLLFQLKAIEKKVGRKYRRRRWAEREIDIDILLYGGILVEDGALRIPHPLMHERFFVLRPLSDLSPDLKHPVFGKDIKTLLGSLECKGRWRQVETVEKRFFNGRNPEEK